MIRRCGAPRRVLAPEVSSLVADILAVCPDVHVLRDPTRGGAASSLNEIAQASNVGITLDENKIPVKTAVSSACELLGMDPIFVANEGKLVAIVSKDDADAILEAMHKTKYGEEAVIIGEVTEKPAGRVLMKTAFGSTRVVDVLAGEIVDAWLDTPFEGGRHQRRLDQFDSLNDMGDASSS